MTETPDPDERYLWDRSGPPDPDVVALERTLGPLAHRAHPRAAAPPLRARRFPLAWVAGAAAAAAVAAFVILGKAPSEPTAPPSDVAAAPAPIVVETRDGASSASRAVAVGQWVRTADEEREVLLGDVGRLTLFPDSRLRLDRLAADSTRFFLERGRLEASIAAYVPQRFFQVDTSAARCVDLGCRYTLDVDDRGVARVRVTSGRVSFEAPGREVYVPAGATCVARPDRGPGTPRFEDAPAALVEAVDAFDAAAGAPAAERRARADRVLELADSRRHALASWHLLQDADADVARRTAASLVARFPDPDAPPAPTAGAPSAEDRDRWKDLLSRDW